MKALQTPRNVSHQTSGPGIILRTSPQTGAAIIETGLSVALVAIIAVAATHSLGGGLQNSVNTIARILNPVSGEEVPLSQGFSKPRPSVALLTGGDINSSKPAGVAKDRIPVGFGR